MSTMSILALPVVCTTGSLQEQTKLAQDKPVDESSHDHKQIRINKDVRQRNNEYCRVLIIEFSVLSQT